MVLKRVPLGSLREEFLIEGKKFIFGRKGCEWKNLKFSWFIYSTHKKTVQRGWLRWKYVQYARTSCCDCSYWRCKSLVWFIYCFFTVGNVKPLQLSLWFLFGRNWQCLHLYGRNMKKTWRTSDLVFVMSELNVMYCTILCNCNYNWDPLI